MSAMLHRAAGAACLPISTPNDARWDSRWSAHQTNVAAVILSGAKELA